MWPERRDFDHRGIDPGGRFGYSEWCTLWWNWLKACCSSRCPQICGPTGTRVPSGFFQSALIAKDGSEAGEAIDSKWESARGHAPELFVQPLHCRPVGPERE
jgi:hypothetical protein